MRFLHCNSKMSFWLFLVMKQLQALYNQYRSCAPVKWSDVVRVAAYTDTSPDLGPRVTAGLSEMHHSRVLKRNDQVLWVLRHMLECVVVVREQEQTAVSARTHASLLWGDQVWKTQIAPTNIYTPTRTNLEATRSTRTYQLCGVLSQAQYVCVRTSGPGG